MNFIQCFSSDAINCLNSGRDVRLDLGICIVFEHDHARTLSSFGLGFWRILNFSYGESNGNTPKNNAESLRPWTAPINYDFLLGRIKARTKVDFMCSSGFDVKR